MRNILIFTIIAILAPNLVEGQEKKYPYPLKPGQRFTGSVQVDTLFWVLKSSQYDKAISDIKSYKKEVQLLEMKTTSLDEIITKNDSTISELKIEKGRLFNKWEASNMKLEDSEVKILKLKRWTLFSGVLGVGAGVLLGALVF